MVTLSDRQALYEILGGLQAGGTCQAWIAGLIACEALRLTQRFDQNTSLLRRSFVYFGLAMSVTSAGLFAAVLYHYCVENYGDFEAVRHLTSFLRYHFICGRIATFAGFMFYTHSVWLSDTGKMRVLKIPIILIILVLLNLCLYALFIVRMRRIFKIPSFVEFGENWLFHRRGQVIQLVCGTILTLIKAYDLSRSDEITKVLATKNDPLGCAWGVLCLLCQTAIFPTVFDAISLWQNGGGMVTGAAYTTLSISAQFHLLGPLLAISAALDEDEVIDLGTPCTVEVGDLGVRDTCGKHITFEQADKELRESKGPAP
ncbi:hypothetical protein PSTG_10203 [Puccinia striiformis f. sp. tritici PST-78]|uniref:Uncharacterized protein n=1 Tax=Puccinia striiformis f. sp. tritici PST-78 TaxID=1165861 RepID=A0A0L0VBE0_9BASI|nr:hypothetical protein PSTG_10203 [Puccinia striiformis f. sp. tritici PST-78]